MAISATRTLEFKFGKKHIGYMRRCRHCQVNVAEGAVRAGKTVDNVFAFATELENTPDVFHLASGSTMANAKLNIGVCNGYGLEAQFRGRCHWGKYKGNEALYVDTPTGQKIVIFCGGTLSNSYAKIRGNSFGMWIATEINLHHSSFIEEASNRQLAARHLKLFWDLNPSHPRHEIYTRYIDAYAKKQAAGTFPAGYNYEHFTIFDNATLPPGRTEEIVSRYDEGSIQYVRDILGQRSIAEGLIYTRFASVSTSKDNYYAMTLEEAKELIDHHQVGAIVIGVDFGGNGSGHSFVCTTHTLGFKTLIALSSELHREMIAGGRKQEIDPDMLGQLLITFVRRMIKIYGPIKEIRADSAEPVLIRGLKSAMKKAGMANIKIYPALKRRVNDRIDCMATLLAQKRFRYVKHECETLESAMQTCVWNPKPVERERLDDGTSDIDTMDGFEYSYETDIEKFVPK